MRSETVERTTGEWYKSSFSNGRGGMCVEIMNQADGGRSVRDSKNPAGPVLDFSADEWGAFTAGVRAGEFG